MCVGACPRGQVVMSSVQNRTGYFYAEVSGAGCTGCGLCALVCPDVAIEVWREGSGVVTEAGGAGLGSRRERVKEGRG